MQFRAKPIWIWKEVLTEKPQTIKTENRMMSRRDWSLLNCTSNGMRHSGVQMRPRVCDEKTEWWNVRVESCWKVCLWIHFYTLAWFEIPLLLQNSVRHTSKDGSVAFSALEFDLKSNLVAVLGSTIVLKCFQMSTGSSSHAFIRDQRMEETLDEPLCLA